MALSRGHLGGETEGETGGETEGHTEGSSRRGKGRLRFWFLSDDENRRIAFRAPIELKVEYKRLNTFFADYTRNISRGGTFIGTDKPLKIGTEFVFALGIPHMVDPLRLRGKVIWTTDVNDATKANPAGMGIEFQYDEGERVEKEAAVERLLSAELGEHLATKLLGRKPQL